MKSKKLNSVSSNVYGGEYMNKVLIVLGILVLLVSTVTAIEYIDKPMKSHIIKVKNDLGCVDKLYGLEDLKKEIAFNTILNKPMVCKGGC